MRTRTECLRPKSPALLAAAAETCTVVAHKPVGHRQRPVLGAGGEVAEPVQAKVLPERVVAAVAPADNLPAALAVRDRPSLLIRQRDKETP
jgi:hypothetical protein